MRSIRQVIRANAEAGLLAFDCSPWLVTRFTTLTCTFESHAAQICCTWQECRQVVIKQGFKNG